MKKISFLLAVLTLSLANLALAQGAAIVTGVSGSAQVQTGSTSPHALRQGDEVHQGDTVFTGPNSSLVLKFDDGEVTALTANSRMAITAYQYQPEARSGNILLSLVTGGMRAITGLIGRSQPDRVAYRAATATIGIRGTDIDLITDGTNVAVFVHEGAVRFSYQSNAVDVSAGQAAFTSNGQIRSGPNSDVSRQIPPGMQGALGGLSGLSGAVSAITRMQSESRRTIFGLRIHSMVCFKSFFHVSALRSDKPAINEPIPMARAMYRNAA
jgi:hypothetical protein